MPRDEFLFQKEQCLQKKDKSFQHKWDEKIISLCNTLNSSSSYYTVSSCSGRICVLEVVGKHDKKRSSWVYVTHELAFASDVVECLKSYAGEQMLWLLQEPAILHVCARTIQDAERLLQDAKRAGFSRAHYLHAQKRLTLELMNMVGLKIPVFQTTPLFSFEHLEHFVAIANDFQRHSWETIARFEEIAKFYK